MASQTVADHVLARLREWGVQHVFGYPGDGINGLLAAWGRADDQPRFVQARHEEMAAFTASAMPCSRARSESASRPPGWG